MDERARQTSESQMKPLRPLSGHMEHGSHIAGPQTATELNFIHMRKLCDGRQLKFFSSDRTTNHTQSAAGGKWARMDG